MLAAVDESVGRILAALERARQLDDTVFVFTSDHGYFYGEHGLSVERRLAYEEAIRIPLFIRYPRVIKARPHRRRSSPSPSTWPRRCWSWPAPPPPRACTGPLAVPLLEGRSPPWRDSFLIEYWSDTVFPRMVKMGYDAVRGERYKYIRYRELKGMDELYDLSPIPTR